MITKVLMTNFDNFCHWGSVILVVTAIIIFMTISDYTVIVILITIKVIMVICITIAILSLWYLVHHLGHYDYYGDYRHYCHHSHLSRHGVKKPSLLQTMIMVSFVLMVIKVISQHCKNEYLRHNFHHDIFCH